MWRAMEGGPCDKCVRLSKHEPFRELLKRCGLTFLSSAYGVESSDILAVKLDKRASHERLHNNQEEQGKVIAGGPRSIAWPNG